MDTNSPILNGNVVPNGINGTNGTYLANALNYHQLSQILRGARPDSQLNRFLRWLRELLPGQRWGLRDSKIDPRILADTGWGVIFAPGIDPAIQKSLGKLLEHRQRQAGENYREYAGDKTLQQGENAIDFLVHRKVPLGRVEPRYMPYYLLLVGDPEKLPYSFQYELDVQYALGRLHFDTPEEYERYAQSVVEFETGNKQRARRIDFFGTQNPGDEATALSAAHLVRPLAEWAALRFPDWEVKTSIKEQATKAQLTQLLQETDGPALLFTASHGMGFERQDPRQAAHQGALLCQDWPGPEQWKGAISPQMYFSGDDISSEANLAGLICFHFACYSAGTPRIEDFSYVAQHNPQLIAPRAFVAKLPQRMLSHPKGGALAAVGHIEQAWGFSFMWGEVEQRKAFEDALDCLLEGYPVGFAMEHFNERHAQLSVSLNSKLVALRNKQRVDDRELACLWTANNDARNYVIVGDPAVRLNKPTA